MSPHGGPLTRRCAGARLRLRLGLFASVTLPSGMDSIRKTTECITKAEKKLKTPKELRQKRDGDKLV